MYRRVHAAHHTPRPISRGPLLHSKGGENEKSRDFFPFTRRTRSVAAVGSSKFSFQRISKRINLWGGGVVSNATLAGPQYPG